MTFCLGINVREGLVGIADTRVLSGSECITARKVTIYQQGHHDVDFPIDIVLYARDTYRIIEHRYEKADLLDISNWWQDRLRRSVNDLPSEWIERAFSQFDS